RGTTVHRLGRVSVISRESLGTRTAALSTSSTASSGPTLRTAYHAPRRSTHWMSRRRRAQRWTAAAGVDTQLTRDGAATTPPGRLRRSKTECATSRCPAVRPRGAGAVGWLESRRLRAASSPPSSIRGHPMRVPLHLAALTLLAAIPTSAPTQETPTEKTAAADVIRRMNELERSLALPQLVARLTGVRDAHRDAVVARAKELMDKELLAMADDITRHPETGWKEERSVKILTDYLTAHGFDVEPGVAGLKTAFVARYRRGTPGPNLGVIVEYDALRGTSRDFHGDQHSAQGPVGLAAAVAVAEFLTSSKTPGTVTVYGTPAEEIASPASKTVMYNAGVFKGADVLVRSHSSTATQASAPGFGSCCMNIDVVRFVF